MTATIGKSRAVGLAAALVLAALPLSTVAREATVPAALAPQPRAE